MTNKKLSKIIVIGILGLVLAGTRDIITGYALAARLEDSSNQDILLKQYNSFFETKKVLHHVKSVKDDCLQIKYMIFY